MNEATKALRIEVAARAHSLRAAANAVPGHNPGQKAILLARENEADRILFAIDRLAGAPPEALEQGKVIERLIREQADRRHPTRSQIRDVFMEAARFGAALCIATPSAEAEGGDDG